MMSSHQPSKIDLKRKVDPVGIWGDTNSRHPARHWCVAVNGTTCIVAQCHSMRRSKFDFMRSFEPTALQHGRRFELGPFLYEWPYEIRPWSDVSTEIQIRERYGKVDMG